MLIGGSGVKPFDLEFRRLYAASKPVPEFPNSAPLPDVVRPFVCRDPPSPVYPPIAAPTPLQADHTFPQYASPPRLHDARPTPVPTRQMYHAQNARAQYTRQMQAVNQPAVRLRSMNDNTARNPGWCSQNFYGRALARPRSLFLRPTRDYSYLNKPADTKQ